MSVSRFLLPRFAVFACIVFSNNPVFAQFRGVLQGTVKDASGAVISGANVKLTSRETRAGTIDCFERRRFLSLRRFAARRLRFASLGQRYEYRSAQRCARRGRGDHGHRYYSGSRHYHTERNCYQRYVARRRDGDREYLDQPHH